MISPRSLSPPAGPSAEAVLRYGHALLWSGLAATMALALAVAWFAPDLVILVPLGLLALIGGWVLFQRPAVNLSVLLAGFAVTLNYDEGVQLQEALYGLYYYAFVGYWYGSRMLRGERFVLTPVDRAVALVAVLGLVAGIGLGVLFGGNLSLIRGEATAFAMLGLYFPVKELCRQERYGPEILLAVLLWIGLFLAVRHFLNFRAIILAATEAWHVADARPGLNEMQLLVPSLFALVLLIHERTWLRRLLLLGAFLLLVGALVLTKARGYWIDFAFGAVVLTMLLRGRHRWRLIFLMVGGMTGVAVLAFVLFGPLAELIVSGTARRFASLGTAFTEDRSLVNRFIETRAVWDGIKQNPLLGYGFGTTFSYFDINYLTTRTKAFIHNGYIALWFKIGLGGMLLMLFAWAGATWQGLKAYWDQRVPLRHRLFALSAGLSLIAITPSAGTSNPFILMDQVYTFTLQLAFAAGIYQRYLLPNPPSGSPPAP